MPEARGKRRFNRRFTLKFGTETANKVAFTEDISFDGLFIKTVSLLRPGTTIVIDLIMIDNAIVRLQAEVIWAKLVPHSMINLLKKSGMGVKIIKFLEGKDIYDALCKEMNSR